MKQSIIIHKSIIFLSLLVILFFSGCAKRPKEPKPEAVTIAFQQWVGYGPFYLAQEKGFFKEEGVELLFIDEPIDSARCDAFKEGMLDCEAGTIDLLVSKRAQGAPVTAVFELDHSFGGDGIVATEDIRKIEDLIGKRVAFTRDDVNETLISYLFSKKGLSLNGVIIVARGPEEVDDAFLNNEADAVVTWEPFLSNALKRTGSHILISTKDEPGIIIDTLNVREDMVKDSPALVRKLIRGWFKAVKYYEEHPLEASEIIAKHYNMTAAEYQNSVSGLRWAGYKEQVFGRCHEEMVDIFNSIADIKFENKRISNKPDSKNAINDTLIKGLYENSK